MFFVEASIRVAMQCMQQCSGILRSIEFRHRVSSLVVFNKIYFLWVGGHNSIEVSHCAVAPVVQETFFILYFNFLFYSGVH